jgi:4-amino-4-deoxy-L-arabinose transferase-like glycosyltransferase
MATDEQTQPQTAFPVRDLLAVMAVALVARVLLLMTGSVSFHSDEAIVALMARHMLQGEFPVFFYGQAYMGSLNAMSTAAGFVVMGESVLAIRIVQLLKFVLFVGTGYWTAWHLSRRRVVALVAGLLLAVPHTMGAIYTATNIGGYVETLIFGNLMLILAYDLAYDDVFFSVWRWLLLGLIAGVAWWTNGLIVVFALPVALVLLVELPRRLRERGGMTVALVLLALTAFIIGGLPWWVYDFTHNHAALAMYIPAVQGDDPTFLVGVPDVPLPQKVMGLVLFTVPTIVGLRYTWSASYFLPVIGLPVLLLHVAALYWLIRTDEPRLRRGVRGLLLLIAVVLVVIFLGTGFGADPTGRYFLPLLLPLAIAIGAFSDYLRERLRRPLLWMLPTALVIGYYAAGQFSAALRNDPGVTTQFDLVNHIPHTHDDALIAFLEANDLQHGYANYWVAVRTAFLSGERIQYSSALPYKPSLMYNPADNRYPPYMTATENAERVAYINTTLLPELDPVLIAYFEEAGVTYRVEQVGDFIIYYDFAPEPPRIRFRSEEHWLER